MSQLITAVLHRGASYLSSGLRDRIADYVLSNHKEDGGYPGRRGDSDPYYTDFALRILSLTRPEEIRRPATLAYAEWNETIADIPECFNRLSIAQLCDTPLPRKAGECLDRHRLASGCYCRAADLPEASAYCTFLGSLCEEIMGLDSRNWLDSANQILTLQSGDGGFSDTNSARNSQTNSTSAAAGFLIQAGLFDSRLTSAHGPDFGQAVDRAGGFLLRMQAEEGGFRAHEKGSYPDLLSTFTALATLAAMERIKEAALKRHIHFVGLLAEANGGFRSCAVDTGSDIEYTYYGLGCLALVAFIAKTRFE